MTTTKGRRARIEEHPSYGMPLLERAADAAEDICDLHAAALMRAVGAAWRAGNKARATSDEWDRWEPVIEAALEMAQSFVPRPSEMVEP